VIVRHDVNLDAIGEVSDLPPDSSPIQLGTSGRLGGRPFTVIGRIVYEYDDGGWNEWHLAYDSGDSGWLSDAQAEYAASALVREPRRPLPAPDKVVLGLRYTWNHEVLEVTTITRARYVGVEGELPFEYWGKSEALFADLRTHSRTFATFDYSDPAAPLLFIGQFVDYDELELRNVRTFEGW
jgi:hypothetical protein